MRWWLLLLLTILSLKVMPAFALGSCFIATENGKIMKEEGDCDTRYAPCSTFKIPIALIGYDSGILATTDMPVFHPKDEHEWYINVCKGAHSPRTWLRDSCLWYSRVVTAKLGMRKFRTYVEKLNYGNKDISGDDGKNNGLSHSWISSSLEISPREQIAFLEKLIGEVLPVSGKAHNLTKKIMFVQEFAGGWKIYGKTGNGSLLSEDRKRKLDIQHGWFVGWIEKDGRMITFASHIVDSDKQETFASFRARNEALIKLWYLIDELEK